MDRFFDLLQQRWHGKRSKHALEEHEWNETNALINQEAQNTTSQLHFVFFEETGTNDTLERRSKDALNSAGIKKKPAYLYETINGFVVPLTQLEADSLLQIPGIGSVEADRPMLLTPPVETKRGVDSENGVPDTHSSSQSIGLVEEIKLEKTFIGDSRIR